MDAAQLILYVTGNLTILPGITKKTTQVKFTAAHADSETTNHSNSEVAVIESIEVRNILQFLCAVAIYSFENKTNCS